MASISRDPNGTRRIQFVAPDGTRKTIRLGKASQRGAEAVKFRVEQLLAAKLTGHALETDTAAWLASIEAALADKLARVGLIPERTPAAVVTLGAFLKTYVAGRADVKGATKVVWGHSTRNLLEHFGDSRDVRSITAARWPRLPRNRGGEADRGDRESAACGDRVPIAPTLTP